MRILLRNALAAPGGRTLLSGRAAFFAPTYPMTAPLDPSRLGILGCALGAACRRRRPELAEPEAALLPRAIP